MILFSREESTKILLEESHLSKLSVNTTIPVLQMLNDLVEMRIKNIHQYKRKISDCSYIGDLEDTNNDLARKMSINKSKH